MGQGVLDPDTAMIATRADRGAFGRAARVRRRPAFLNEIGIAHATMLRVTVTGSAFATASGTKDFASALPGHGGDDDAKVVLGEQRTDAAAVFVVLRVRRGCEQQRGEQQERRRPCHAAAANGAR